ncbi:hypothetical protein [Lutibacter sp.]|uniref:hypothetical protein n=1 Tax=Lutibacter sp. TaxID=1925666 RepID=UPI00273594B4|nr:hypothetical protein [Lutibacter sp.]MDP3313950.1 hypothetical protein [Lutibacter sp.]
MKNLFFVFAFIISINISAQEEIENATVFVRVYDLQGKKISKGKILSISDTSIQLKGKLEPKEIYFNNISFIKTKHSVGNNLLIGAVSGASFFAILGAATADPDAWIFAYSAGEGAAAGAVIGGISGSVIGGITALFKNSKTYAINGDELKWKNFKNTMTILKH